METHVLVSPFRNASSATAWARELRDFLDAGLLRAAPAPDTVIVEEPDELLPRLARLHHELGLAPEALDLVLPMRQRLLRLQAALARETARARQLERLFPFCWAAGGCFRILIGS